MEYFFASLIILGLFMAAMAVGVIFSNKPLKGSCGGLNKLFGLKCSFCAEKDQCKKKEAEESGAVA